MRLFTISFLNLKSVFFLSFALLCFLIGILLYIFLFSKENIILVNESQYFTVEYTPTEKFTEYMSKWGVWTKENFFISNEGKLIKAIELRFTDEKQDELVNTYNNLDVWSSGSSFTNDETLQIKIFINSQIFNDEELKGNYKRNIDRIVLLAVLENLYQKTHSFEEVRQRTENFSTQFKNEELPFKVTLSNETK